MELALRIKIVLMMAKFGSPTQVIRELKGEGIVNIPSNTSITNLYQKFCEFGTVHDLPISGRPKISEKKMNLIEEILHKNPRSTLTQISNQTGVSRSTAQRRIKFDIGQRSYVIQTHQELYEEDYDRRVEMADNLLPILRDPAYKNRIFFSDEAIFHESGRVHKHNYRIWGYEKPVEVETEPLDSPKLIVWCTMSSECIIGPLFF